MKEKWQTIVQRNLAEKSDIFKISGLETNKLNEIQKNFPIKINQNISKSPFCYESPIWKQFLPSSEELKDSGQIDPLHEKKFQTAPNIIHRYPNRVLFLVSNRCASYCRFCTRKRIVGKTPNPSWKEIYLGLEYIKGQQEINEVILSGGDPLLLEDEKLNKIIQKLRKINHIEIIRISTRTLLTLPERITDNLLKLIKSYQPIYLLAQFNHPDELSNLNEKQITKLINNGIPILNQSVLLKGINDKKEVMLCLVQKLVKRRIRPYYLHQLDPAQGTLHFRVTIKKGKKIIQYLRENIGGFAVPTYVFDDPTAKSKVIL